MSPPRVNRVVVVIALEGDDRKVRACVTKAATDGLHPVLFTSPDGARRLRLLSADLGWLQTVAVESYPMQGLRGGVRSLVERSSKMLAAFIYRGTRAARHRLGLPPSASNLLESIGARSQTMIPHGGSALVDRLIEPFLHVLGFVATKFHHVRTMNVEVGRLLRGNSVVGVACLDDASLLPGWILSRKFPTLPVIAGYPNQWDVDAEVYKDLFELGDKW